MTLTRTGWWRVPLSYDRLVGWYAAHTPADVASTYPPGSRSPAPQAVLTWATPNTSPAYSSPVEVVDYARLGPQLTAIRADVTLAARADRTAETFAPQAVFRINITKQAIDGPDTTPKTGTVLNQSKIRPVVLAFNRLQGDFASVQGIGCGSPVGVVYSYALTFYGPGHHLVVSPGQQLCGVGRGLTLDGVTLPQTLEDSSSLDQVLASAFRGW